MRTNSLAVVSFFVAGALVACGGSSTTGSGTLSGTVAGKTFSVASEVAILGPAAASSTGCGVEVLSDGGVVGDDSGCVPTTSTSGQLVSIVLTNRAEASCADFQTGEPEGLANLDALALDIFTETGTLTTGTYDLAVGTAGSGAEAEFHTSTSTCGPGVNIESASAGSITLTQLSAGSVAGSYSVTFGTMGTFTGSFDVPFCSLPSGIVHVSDGGPLVCKP